MSEDPATDGRPANWQALERDAAHKVSKGRAELVLSQPFFGTLALRLTPVADWSEETFATDGTSLFYNPAFVVATPQRQITGILAHEVMHCALGHHARRGHRDGETWNEAGDFAINGILRNTTLELPASALYDAAYDGMSADAIYSKIHRPKPQGQGGQSGQQGAGTGPQGQQGQQGGQPGQQGQGNGQQGPNGQGGQQGQQRKDFGGTGRVKDAPQATSEAGRSEAETEWKIATIQAAQAAKAAGKLPGDIARMVEEFRKPKHDWRAVLRRFLSAPAADDYTWMRPNRRHVGRGLYLPSMRSERVGVIGVVVDTSGSVSEEELAVFAAETNAIVKDVLPAKVRVVFCDTKVRAVEEVDPATDDLVFKAKGGGGTNMVPAFERLTTEAEHDEQPVCIVCLTDLEFYRWPDEPDMPVLWVTTGRTEAPYGEVIEFDAEVGA